MLLLRVMSGPMTMQWHGSLWISMAYIITRDYEDVPGLGNHWDHMDVQEM